MERGTRLYFRFETKRDVLELARSVDALMLVGGFQHGVEEPGTYWCSGPAGEPRVARVDSIEQLAASPIGKFTSLGMQYKSNNPFRTQIIKFPGEWISSGQTTGFVLCLNNSDFWPEFLDMDAYDNKPPRVTFEEYVHDYRFVKHLFAALDADLCIGSHLGEYFPFDDRDADLALRFTKNGPQKLVRPLEENRLPYRAHMKTPVPYDEFAIDPATGLPKWAWIVDKPFIECLNLTSAL